jgi:glyoxylase-like metal-dependent hydrolase (beta-lactamase superfamily II)
MDAGQILTRVKSRGLTIRLIVLTHGHIDHIGALADVREATGAELALHEAEAQLLVMETERVMTMMGRQYKYRPPDILLQGGGTVRCGDLEFLVLHTPGHTLGGICLYGHGVVFSGDTLFNYGIGRTDFPGGSYRQILDSIHTKLMVLPATTVVYPGHGPKTTINAERRGNPFLRGM